MGSILPETSISTAKMAAKQFLLRHFFGTPDPKKCDILLPSEEIKKPRRKRGLFYISFDSICHLKRAVDIYRALFACPNVRWIGF